MRFLVFPILILLIIFLGAWVFLFLGGVVGIGFIAWLCGAPISIKTNGNTKTYRWTKRIK